MEFDNAYKRSSPIQIMTLQIDDPKLSGYFQLLEEFGFEDVTQGSKYRVYRALDVDGRKFYVQVALPVDYIESTHFESFRPGGVNFFYDPKSEDRLTNRDHLVESLFLYAVRKIGYHTLTSLIPTIPRDQAIANSNLLVRYPDRSLMDYSPELNLGTQNFDNIVHTTNFLRELFTEASGEVGLIMPRLEARIGKIAENYPHIRRLINHNKRPDPATFIPEGLWEDVE